MIDVTRNGCAFPTRSKRIVNEDYFPHRDHVNVIEDAKDKIVGFISHKPGTAVVAGVILGAAIALLVGRRRK